MAAPSQEELKVLEQFRDAIKTESIHLNERQGTDMALLAWLRARDMDIPKAVEMLKKSMVWRQEEDMDTILEWIPPNNYPKDFPYEISGRSVDSDPVLILPFGKWDVRKAVQAGEKITWIRHFDQMLAVTLKDMDETNDTLEPGMTPVTQFIIIADLEGFSFRQLTSVLSVQTILECVNRFEGNYPEILKTCYVINVPAIFAMLFSIIKPLVSTRTLSKVEIFNSDETKWKLALLKNISESQLPVKLGGTNQPTRMYADLHTLHSS